MTSFQRYFLETLACYEFLTYWKNLQLNDDDEPQPVAHVVGTFTVDIELAIKLFHQGVPVWLVRHPQNFPLSTTILNLVAPTFEPMELEFLEGSTPLWSGDASAFHNRVCQFLWIASIRLGHAAYKVPVGHFLPVVNQSQSLIIMIHFYSLFHLDRCCSLCQHFAKESCYEVSSEVRRNH